MKGITTLIFFLIFIVLHVVAFLGLLLSWLIVFNPFLLRISIIAIGALILIDIVLGLYYLIYKPPHKKGLEYHKLKIEEADKAEKTK